MNTLTEQLGDDPPGAKIFDFSMPWPQRTMYDLHRDQAEDALSRFEQTGDWKHGLAALVHAVLSVDMTEAGKR